MTKIAYIKKRFSESSLATIAAANNIIDYYEGRDMVLTLRQLYYQFVSKDLIPNKQSEYKRLGSIINDARMAGLISWKAMEDRGRRLMGYNTYESVGDRILSASWDFKIDLWEDQKFHPEVWVEKEALSGVIGSPCNKNRVDYFSCKGYTSQSSQWEAGQRFIDKINEGKKVVILHFGDHDPSGIDMTRDNLERLRIFIEKECDDGRRMFEVRRMALNMNQVEEYNPPPNPAKLTDSRFGGYAEKFGNESWELDALDPDVIADIINNEISKLRDSKKWESALKREKGMIDTMKKIAREHA